MPTPTDELVGDATERLAVAYRPQRAALAEPVATDPCDRCGRHLGARICRLGRGDLGGTEMTWWICLDCDRDLSLWFRQAQASPILGGTK